MRDDGFKITMGTQYRTRERRPVRILATDRRHPNYPVVALVGDEDSIFFYMADGRQYEHAESPNDLVPVPVKREGWINIYRVPRDERHTRANCPGYPGTNVYASRHDADRWASAESTIARRGNRIACIHIQFTEGEGL